MNVLILVVATLAFSTAQAPQEKSVTGAWAGLLVIKHDGKTEEHYVHVVLKQSGGAVTGTAGPDADNQYPIVKGKVTAAKDVTTITFEFIANGVHTAFNLKFVDGTLKGEAKIEGEDGKVHVAEALLQPAR